MILANKYHIQMELSELYSVLIVGSFGDTLEGMERLLSALREISDDYYGKGTPKADFLDIPPIPLDRMRESEDRRCPSASLS